jgi:4-hydroxy-3-methylbut-2-enyl diphosphate reductase
MRIDQLLVERGLAASRSQAQRLIAGGVKWQLPDGSWRAIVKNRDEVPDGATVIFSAHGVSSAVEQEAARRGLNVFDATCPLVTKVHMEVRHHARDAREVILIGHEGHPEVDGTLGRFDPAFGGRIHLVQSADDARRLEVADPEKLAFVTQTTLSVDDTAEIVDILRRRFPALQGPRKEDICYATQNRQDAVKVLAPAVDVVIVVGSHTSSNSNRLRELAQRLGTAAYMVDAAEDLQAHWLEGRRRVGLTAGASAPDILVQQVIARLREMGAGSVRKVDGVEEKIRFPLPLGLGDKSMAEVTASRS